MKAKNKCTYPDCDCIAIAELINNNSPVKNYPCREGETLDNVKKDIEKKMNDNLDKIRKMLDNNKEGSER